MKPDRMLGRLVEIRSLAGIVYNGVIRSIRDAGELGEIFELGSDTNDRYQRFIHVKDRLAQIREFDAKRWLTVEGRMKPPGGV